MRQADLTELKNITLCAVIFIFFVFGIVASMIYQGKVVAAQEAGLTQEMERKAGLWRDYNLNMEQIQREGL